MKKNLFIAGGVGLIAVIAAIIFITRSGSPVNVAEITITPEVYENGLDIFITPQDLKAQLGSKDLVLIDGNHPKNYAKGHIPGAISIGFKGLSRAEGKPGDPLWGTILPKDELTAKLESFGVTNDSLIVAYSDTFKGPGAGGRAVWQLRMAGLKNVKLLYGGLNVWRQLGYETTKNLPAPVASSGLVLRDYNEEHSATQDYLKETLGKRVIIDVRSKKEYTGDDTSRGESRGGHIKGAKWLEWTQFLNEDATPKSPEEIKELLAGIGVTPEDDFSVY